MGRAAADRRPGPLRPQPLLFLWLCWLAAGCPALGGNGEITYAEVKVTQTTGDNVLSGSSWTSNKASQLWRRTVVPYAAHFLMGTCLLLLVTAIWLGARHFQNSLQLRETKQRLQALEQQHQTLNDSKYQSIMERERDLMDIEDRLTETKRQCDQDGVSWRQTQHQLQVTENQLREAGESLQITKQALSNTESSLRKREAELAQSQNALNQERKSRNDLSDRCRRTDSKFDTCNSDLSGLRSRFTTSDNNLRRTNELLKRKEAALEQVEEQLNAEKYLISTLCNKQFGSQHFSGGTHYFIYCPLEWILISGKCYFFSEKKETRRVGESYCKSKGARLAVVKSQDLKDYINEMSQEYWIGLKKENYKWTWSDGTTGTVPDAKNYYCVAWGKELIPKFCSQELQWICEKESLVCTAEECLKDFFTI